MLHQALGRQREQGLAHRHARDAELGRELVLDQPLARAEPAVEDLAADLLAHDLLRDARALRIAHFFDRRHEGRDPRLAAGDVLLAVAARGRHRADALAVDEDREAADEHREAALVLGEDAERLLAGQAFL